jgi:hypothetical protein
MSDINNIVENIERSVLVIGPGIVLDKDGNSLSASFAERYSQRNKGLIKHYFDTDNLIRPKNSVTRMTIQKNFAEFYEKEFSEGVRELYGRISQIPYPLIISLNPDNTLTRCFEESGSPYIFDFYRKGKKSLVNEIPSTKIPFLFNLYGCYTEPESLILTYDDLFEYLRNILPGDGLPTSIRSALKNAVNITFLGVEFEKWYFQLLVKLLTEYDEKFELLRYAAPDLSTLNTINSICENNFEITFVDSDVSGFIDELYYHCYKHKDNALRGEPILSGGKVFNPEIFISYKHSGESEVLADKLFDSGKLSGLNIIYDKANLKYKGKTWEFMERIGWGKYVVVIVSDEYLKSAYCMYEFKEVLSKGGKIEDRIFPIVMPDADIYKEINRNKYEKYWKDEIDNLKSGLKDLDSDGLFKRFEVIAKYEEILKSIPLMLDFLDKRNSLTHQIMLDENFIPLFTSIEEKIQKDLEI